MSQCKSENSFYSQLSEKNQVTVSLQQLAPVAEIRSLMEPEEQRSIQSKFCDKLGLVDPRIYGHQQFSTDPENGHAVVASQRLLLSPVTSTFLRQPKIVALGRE